MNIHVTPDEMWIDELLDLLPMVNSTSHEAILPIKEPE